MLSHHPVLLIPLSCGIRLFLDGILIKRFTFIALCLFVLLQVACGSRWTSGSSARAVCLRAGRDLASVSRVLVSGFPFLALYAARLSLPHSLFRSLSLSLSLSRTSPFHSFLVSFVLIFVSLSASLYLPLCHIHTPLSSFFTLSFLFHSLPFSCFLSFSLFSFLSRLLGVDGTLMVSIKDLYLSTFLFSNPDRPCGGPQPVMKSRSKLRYRYERICFKKVNELKAEHYREQLKLLIEVRATFL